MIIVKLVGGLGNQMFQYALGRYLAEMHGVALKLDITWYKKGIREYELKYLNIQGEIATGEEVREMTKMTTSLAHRIDRNIVQPLLPYYKRYHVAERTPAFDANILKIGGKSYLTGYWQSELYFKPIAVSIRKEFQIKAALCDENLEIANEISRTNAVSLHVRRGDYVSNPDYNKIFATCGLDYYTDAIKLMSDRIKNPHFFVFSDDPLWVMENLSISFPHSFVTHNTGIGSYRDMQLMSLCQHNIIANSTFSWWGAWLNANQDKIVIAPKKWLVNEAIPKSTLIPNNWTSL